MTFPVILTVEPVVRLTPQARILAAVLAIGFMVWILDLIRREKLTERYSIVWFLLGLLMLAGAAFPGLLELLARLLGVRDATIALFSLLLLVLLGLAISFSVIASGQSKQITRLAQQAAIDSVEEDPDPPTEPKGRRSGSDGADQ